MKFLGLELTKPTFAAVTRATIFAVVIWTIWQLSPLQSKDASAAGALLVSVLFGTISAECGLLITRGLKYFAAQLAGLFVCLIIYSLIVSIVTASTV